MESILNFIYETEQLTWAVGGGLVSLGVLKASSLTKLKTIFSKTKQTVENLDGLAENAIGDIIRSVVVEELAKWEDKHLTCHERQEADLRSQSESLVAMQQNQVGIINQLMAIGSDLSNIRGQIEGMKK